MGGVGLSRVVGVKVGVLSFVFIFKGKIGKDFKWESDIRFVFVKSYLSCCGRI